MYKGISFFFGYPSDPEERTKMIKEAGFTHVITNADKKWDYQNGSFKKQIKLFKKYGLKHSSLHMRYNRKDLPSFWEKGKLGETVTKNIIKDVKLAKKYGFTCVVVHARGDKYTEIGEQRIKKILKVCEKTNIPLAFENLNCHELFSTILQKFQSPYVKVCYDSGHNNAYHKGFDYFKHYGDKIITLHLHDNDGTEDYHTLNQFGNIDWQELAKKLKKSSITILDYELLPEKPIDGIDIKEFLQIAMKQANELEGMIENKKA